MSDETSAEWGAKHTHWWHNYARLAITEPETIAAAFERMWAGFGEKNWPGQKDVAQQNFTESWNAMIAEYDTLRRQRQFGTENSE